jgi:hypothetical protein
MLPASTVWSQRKHASNERMTVKRCHLTSDNLMRVHQSRWHHRRERFIPLRDRHFKNRISVAVLIESWTKFDDIPSEGETEFTEQLSRWFQFNVSAPELRITPQRDLLSSGRPRLENDHLTGNIPKRTLQSRLHYHQGHLFSGERDRERERERERPTLQKSYLSGHTPSECTKSRWYRYEKWIVFQRETDVGEQPSRWQHQASL